MRIAFFLFITSLVFMQGQVPSDSVPQAKDSMPESEADPTKIWDFPTAIFTLPEPQSYKLTKEAKNILMFCLAINRDDAAIWRDEYKNIYENRLRLWTWLGNTVMERTKGVLARALHSGQIEPSAYIRVGMTLAYRQENLNIWDTDAPKAPTEAKPKSKQKKSQQKS